MERNKSFAGAAVCIGRRLGKDQSADRAAKVQKQPLTGIRSKTKSQRKVQKIGVSFQEMPHGYLQRLQEEL